MVKGHLFSQTMDLDTLYKQSSFYNFFSPLNSVSEEIQNRDIFIALLVRLRTEKTLLPKSRFFEMRKVTQFLYLAVHRMANPI